MKYDKHYYVVCAVYRMLKMQKINFETGVCLLHKRAKLNEYTAKATVELWFRYPLKHLQVKPE